MREIKFRCYDKNESYMLPWEHLVQAGDLPEMLLHGHEEDADYSKLMQYTGLKDSKGVEIYEGDIGVLKDGSRLFQVYFDEGAFWIGEVGRSYDHYYGLTFEWRHFGVKGNIYEHPHQLEESK